MASYAVGDLQGCYEPLMRLLDKLEFDSCRDELWCVGDLVNRGPDSLKVLQFCQSLGSRFICTLGNHDLHLLAVAACQRRVKRQDTFGTVLTSPQRDELLHWLSGQKLLHYDKTRGLAMVHAGIAPQWSIKKALRLASEVEAVLRDANLANLYYRNMYGNLPTKWSATLSGPVRWRVITNYLTRMRFCSPKGHLELHTKTGPDAPPTGYLPWFQVPTRKAADTGIIFGHWAALLGQANTPNIYALDTGCVWGHCLTAIDLDRPELRVSVAANKTTN